MTLQGDQDEIGLREDDNVRSDADTASDAQDEPDGTEERPGEDESDLWSPGLPDAAFVRGGGPLVPSEVRVLALAKAHLYPTARVLDIGAGVGGLTVEAALLCSEGEVVAFERDQQARTALRLNLDRFDLESVRVEEGRSPNALRELGRFDRVLLSGDSRISETLEVIPAVLNPDGRLVAIAQTVESMGRVVSALRSWPWDAFEAVQMSLARAVPSGSLLRMEALDPVWIVAADLAQGERGPLSDR